jgi:DNA modification methylase
VSEPGDRIVDCFGGAGTSLLAATKGRDAILIEIEDYYANIIQDSIEEIYTKDVGEGGNLTVIRSDNRLAMPVPCDHIITSPPYGNDLAKESEEAGLTATVGQQGMQYTNSNQNLGKMQPFIYKQQMKKVYKLMVESVKVGGTITITHRDRMKEGERLMYVDSIVGTLVSLGCRVKMLDKWSPPGSLAARVNEKLGVEIVEDEDIICMERVR